MPASITTNRLNYSLECAVDKMCMFRDNTTSYATGLFTCMSITLIVQSHITQLFIVLLVENRFVAPCST